MSLLNRRKLLNSPAELYIYNEGIITSGYNFSYGGVYGSAGAGVSASSAFSFEANNLKLRCWDNDETSATGVRGTSFTETTGLTRDLLSKYSTLNFSAYATPISAGVQYYHVGLYSNTTPTVSSKIITADVTSASYQTLSISTSSILSASTTDIFHLGAGILTVWGKRPGTCNIFVNKIWLS